MSSKNVIDINKYRQRKITSEVISTHIETMSVYDLALFVADLELVYDEVSLVECLRKHNFPTSQYED